MSKKVWICVIAAQIINFSSWCQSGNTTWIDSVMREMDLNQKIGQLIMIQVNATDNESLEDLYSAVDEFHIGGVVFTSGRPTGISNAVGRLKQLSAVPLLVGVNAEEGLGSAIDSTILFPPAIMMGSMARDSMMYFVGKEIGKELRELGVLVNFGPTLDLSTSFESEELINHTYGDIKENVASKTVLYMKGLQAAGIIPIAKYYTNSSIKVTGFKNGNPIVKNLEDPSRLFTVRRIAEAGCPGILLANRQEPIFPNRRYRFTKRKKKVSVSVPSIYTAQYLKETVKFNGLVLSYIPDVKPALNKKFKNGDSEVYAFKAGNDILLSPKNIKTAVRKLKKEISHDKSLEQRLDQSVRKILTLKYNSYNTRIEQSNVPLMARLKTTEGSLLLDDVYQQSITVAKDKSALLPIKTLDNRKFACITIGNEKANPFTEYLSKYTNFDRYEILNATDSVDLINQLKAYDVVVAGVFPFAANIESVYAPVLKKLDAKKQLVTVMFTTPTKLSLIDTVSTLVQAYVDDIRVQELTPQIIFGALAANAKLPLTINQNASTLTSVTTQAIGRFGYSNPASVGVDPELLRRVDEIAREAIDVQATPGCQILIARKGKVIYEKSFGYQTYDKKVPINNETIYDLASVTKVAATLQGVMFLYEKGLININKKISYYLPELINTNKKDIIIKDILTHQAGLWPFIPFWTQTKKDTVFMPEFYSKYRSIKFPFQVAPHLFAVQSMRDSIWSWTMKSKLREKAPRTPYNYTYSDIGLYLMFRLNEKLFNQSQEEFLNQNLYEPLGANSMGYLPLNRFDASRIAPTENDKLFRNELLIGTVHDEGAAMNGGVAGHAGLFGTASDLAKIGQMMLQEGYYGGIQYYKPETVKLFTTQQFETSRRALGWDRPVISDWNTPASFYASSRTFGHTGFTGTCIWVDPEFELVYVFLSNRVYPSRNENKLSSLNIRSRIQDTIYKSIFNYCPYENPRTWITSR